jgi:hypothetical protein
LLNIKRAGLVDRLGADKIHVNLRSAVAWAEEAVARGKGGAAGEEAV